MTHSPHHREMWNPGKNKFEAAVRQHLPHRLPAPRGRSQPKPPPQPFRSCQAGYVAHWKVRASAAALREALRGRIKRHHRFLLQLPAKGRNDTLNEAFKVWRAALAAARS